MTTAETIRSEKSIQIAPLYTGQKVVLQNTSRVWEVVKRAGTFASTTEAMYEIESNGSRITVMRRQLGVCVQGRWAFGPRNEMKG